MKKLVVSFMMVMVLLNMTGCGKEIDYDRERLDEVEDRVEALYDKEANHEEFNYDYTVDSGITEVDSNTKEYWARISVPTEQGGQIVYESTYQVYQDGKYYRVSNDDGVSYFGPCGL